MSRIDEIMPKLIILILKEDYFQELIVIVKK